MFELPTIFRKKTSQLIHIVALPIFFFAFMLIYRPFDVYSDFSLGRFSFGVNVTLISCVIFGSVSILRALFCLIRNRIDWITYFFWCILEMTVTVFFVALYVWLMDRCTDAYFIVVARACAWIYTVLIYPYVIISLAFFLVSQYRSSHTQTESSESKIKFYDERKSLKLVVLSSSVLYIAAEENYVNINYLEGDNIKSYLLRTTMKSIESLCNEHGLLRCHRSYYINREHIKALRKDKEGVIIAELDHATTPIPVTKRYYDDVSAAL